MSLIVYDIIFLIAFAIFVSVFLYSRKRNLKREGLLFLYKTTWGIKLIDSIGKRNPKLFKILSYISVTIGYLLMVSMIYLLGKIVYLYLTRPDIVQAIKIPPITPLIPYIDKIAPNLGLPPFYFIYFIVIIAIIAITHEVAHGIFAVYNKVKIKSTGFGFFPFFLPIFLAAFVELDEKGMAKKSIFGQLAVLSAGTFANVLTAILFFGVLLIYFPLAFTPTGVIFDDYVYAPIAISSISSVNGISLENADFEEFTNLLNEEGFNEVEAGGKKYVGAGFFRNTNEYVKLYYDAPAINARLERVILSINGIKILNINDLTRELSKYSPNENVTLTVLDENGVSYEKEITLEEHPKEENKAWLGIGFLQQQSREGILGKMYDTLSSFKDKNIYYKESIGELSLFFYNFLWWIVLISLSVALVNMLPVGIFDGGRFFYLTILALTGKEKIAKKAFSFSTYLILFIVLVLMFYWVLSFF